jgi:hypothetical protein
MRPPRPEDLDTNGDWKLSFAEASEIPGMTEERFNECDRDGDGQFIIGEVPPAPPAARRRPTRRRYGKKPRWPWRPAAGRQGECRRGYELRSRRTAQRRPAPAT